MIEMQKEYKDTHSINMFVPDLHSFTTPIDHTSLFDKTIHNLKYFVAAGLDIKDENTLIYRQSFIPAHSELTWILSCFTGVGEMQRMTQFKDKSNEHSESISMGLMTYPILMAADILLYNAKWVPVGEDQFQHLEITRDIATRMNNRFGELFTIPAATKEQTKFIKRDAGLRIRDLVNPEKKMSKSTENEKSKIELSTPPEVAHKRIMSATTDSVGQVNFDWDNQPGITSLLQIYATLRREDQDVVNAKFTGMERYGDFKREVADAVAGFLSEFQDRYDAIDEAALISKLEESEARATEIANETLLRVQRAVGLRR